MNAGLNFGGIERTVFAIKPETLEKDGDKIMKILSEQQPPLKVVAEKTEKMPVSTALKHYAEHKGKSFFDGLINYMTGGKSKVMVVEGESAQSRVRNLTKEVIRPQFAIDGTKNAAHASDAIKSADAEIKIHFPKEKTNLDIQA